MTSNQPRVAVMTGASSGLGKEAAKALAAQGWHIIAVGRDAGRSAAAEGEIRSAAAPGARVDMLLADLSLLADTERLARDIAALTDRIDVLANNAGGMASGLVITPEGNEANFTGNHLGPFLLTERLLPLLRKAAVDAPAGSVRIINTSSDASEMIPTINLDDMQNIDNFSVGAAYCGSKLANVLHARALAQRLADAGIVAHSFHPGTVASNFFANVPPETKAYTDKLDKMSEADGADTLLWLATSDDGAQGSGTYWHKRAARVPNPLIDDADFIARFWAASEQQVNRADA
jgi:NAD(P)-dependent dehydrogenase (short-subunit alcohol dehydrogenase family)